MLGAVNVRLQRVMLMLSCIVQLCSSVVKNFAVLGRIEFAQTPLKAFFYQSSMKKYFMDLWYFYHFSCRIWLQSNATIFQRQALPFHFLWDRVLFLASLRWDRRALFTFAFFHLLEVMLSIFVPHFFLIKFLI